MAKIDYSVLKFAKDKPHWKVIEDAKAERTGVDEAESDKVRKRSKGICEVTVDGTRCKRRAFHVHHQLGGNGRRGRGESALAKNKTHACVQCHEQIGKQLRHVRGNVYKRVG